jgi:hypothetical protein
MAKKKDLSSKQRAKGFAGKAQMEGGDAAIAIEKLASEIKKQNDVAIEKKQNQERNKILSDLVITTSHGDELGKANALNLQASFTDSIKVLQNAIETGDADAIKFAKENQKSILDAADKELETRAAIKETTAPSVTTIAISALTEEIKKQNTVIEDRMTAKDRLKTLSNLVVETKRGDLAGKEQSNQLLQSFKESQERLQQAILVGDADSIALEKENSEIIMSGAAEEEKRRDALKIEKKQNSLLEGISKGISGLAGKAKENAGFLSGIGLLAMSVLDPDKLKRIVEKLTEVFSNAVKMVEGIMTGDFETALGAFKENWVSFTGAFVFFFGGKILKGLKAIISTFTALNKAVKTYRLFLATNYAGSMIAHFKGVMSSLGGKLMKIIKGVAIAAKTFRIFMMTSALPAIAGLFTTMIAAMTPIIVAMAAAIAPILVAAAPFIAIAAGIGLVLFGLKTAFDSVLNTFRETGSIFEAFKAGVITFPATILGLPLDLLKKGISWIMGMFGFDNAKAALDSFSFQDLFKGLFGKVFDTMTSAFGYLVDKFKVFGNFVKAIGLGAVAAVKAAFPGGESPTEAFSRVYNEALSGGSSSDKAETPDLGSSNFNTSSLSTNELSDLNVFASDADQTRDIGFAKMNAIENNQIDSNRFDTVESRNDLSKSLGGKANLEKLSKEEKGLETLVARKLLQFEDQLVDVKDSVETKNEIRKNVMTKDGIKELTKAEIQKGKKDGSIKRSLANSALRTIVMEEKALSIKKPVDSLEKNQEGLLGSNVEKALKEGDSLKQELSTKKPKVVQVINNVQNNQGDTVSNNSTAIQSSGRRRGFGISNRLAFE